MLLKAIASCGWQPTVIISGKAKGADTLGEQYALKLTIPLEEFPANWSKYGRPAGHIRNEEMAENAEALIALWDGKSPGTWNMIKKARTLGLKVFIQNY